MMHYYNFMSKADLYDTLHFLQDQFFMMQKKLNVFVQTYHNMALVNNNDRQHCYPLREGVRHVVQRGENTSIDLTMVPPSLSHFLSCENTVHPGGSKMSAMWPCARALFFSGHEIEGEENKLYCKKDTLCALDDCTWSMFKWQWDGSEKKRICKGCLMIDPPPCLYIYDDRCLIEEEEEEDGWMIPPPCFLPPSFIRYADNGGTEDLIPRCHPHTNQHRHKHKHSITHVILGKIVPPTMELTIYTHIHRLNNKTKKGGRVIPRELFRTSSFLLLTFFCFFIK